MTDKEIRIAIKNGTAKKLYGQEVHRLVRGDFEQGEVEAIVNNYVANPNNVKYKAEFEALQERREKHKTNVKARFNALGANL